jgi:superfamily II DNA or RNA helicase
VKSCAEKAGKIIGVVVGTQEYISRVVLSVNNQINSTHCTCPLAKNCKHTAALFLQYRQRVIDGLGDSSRAVSAEADINNLTSIEVPPTEVLPSSASAPAPAPSPAAPASITDAYTDKTQENLFLIPEASLELKQALFRLATAAQKDVIAPEKTKQSLGPKNKLVYVLHETTNIHPGISAVKISLRKDGSIGKTQVVKIEKLVEQSSNYIIDEDIEIAKLYNTLRGDSYFSYYSISAKLENDPELLKLFMQRILATGRCFLLDDYEHPLTPGEALPGRLAWTENKNGQQYLSAWADKNVDAALESYPCLRWTIPWYVDMAKFICGPVVFEQKRILVEEAMRMRPLSALDAECMQIMLPTVGLDELIPTPKTKRKFEKRIVKPVPSLKIGKVQTTNPKSKTKVISPALVFINHYEQDIKATPFLEDDVMVSLQRDRIQEHKNVEKLQALGFVEFFPSNIFTSHNADCRYFGSENPLTWLKLLESLQSFSDEGWNIPPDTFDNFKPIEASANDLDVRVNEENGWWFSLELSVNIGGKKRPLLPLLVSAIRSLPNSSNYSLEAIDELNINGRFVALLDDCRLLSLPFERIKPILISLHELFFKHARSNQELFSTDGSSFSSDGSSVVLALADLAAILEAEAQYVAEWQNADNLRELAVRFRTLRFDSAPVISSKLKTDLRSYQQEGLSWLQKLAEQKFAGILADDMGLGKTVQMLAFIAAVADAGKLKKRPFLVISPKSVLPNWASECARFVPELKVLTLSGQNRGENFLKAQLSDIVITSYPLLARDIEFLQDINWSGIALDESQAIKNSETLVAQAAFKLKADYRFCLTGTPIENNLAELWSQFRFLLPGFLGKKEDFRKLFQIPIEKNNDHTRRALLSSRVKPFILRRTKDEVATDLPEKSVFIQHVEIDGGQLDLYETVRLSMTKKVRDEIAKKGFKKSQIIVLDALLKLRQVCCDPRLVKISAAKKIAESAKLEMLMEMLEELKQESRKVLVFSQFTSMLDLIADELLKREIRYVELRGDTDDRETPVTEFQTTDVPVFLLSLKAGGTGLNLTAADVVIHYDPWWNPAVEEQATDRAHRIGQTKKVFVYKLVVKGSIEERMMQLQERKKVLAMSIYENTASSGAALSESDIDILLRPIDSLE